MRLHSRYRCYGVAVGVVACLASCGTSNNSPSPPPSQDGGRGTDAHTLRDGTRDDGKVSDARSSATDAEHNKDQSSESKDAGKDAGPAGPHHVTTANSYNLGMNVPGLNYYNNVAIYADVALVLGGNYGPWDKADGSAAAALDASGNPTEAASTGLTDQYPSGDYAVSWDGTGTFAPRNASGVATLGTVATTTSGGVQHNTTTLTFTQQLSATPTAANWVGFSATPPITNLHITAPSSLAAPGNMFMNDYLARLAPFSTLRFMDALNTNGNLVQNWSQRSWPTAGSRTNTPQGMAYEDVIELARETGADIWINVPALATDDYVCRLARLLRYGEQGDMSNSACDPKAPAATATTAPLNAESKVYVEYSNEVWNWGFQQIEDIYCMVWGMPDKTGDGKHCDVTAPTSTIGKTALSDSSLPWSTNTYEKATQFTLVLVKRVSDIFRTVFDCSSGAGCQAQIPMNVQAAYAAEVDPGFAFLKQAYGSVSSIDVMAVAPYFNTDSPDAGSVDSIFGDLTSNILSTSPPSSEGSAIANWLKGDLAEAAMYGLPIVAYEGGQGLSGGSANFITAQSDPRMYQAYLTYFSLWDSLVGRTHLFNHYNFAGAYGSYGSWGALVNEYDPGTEKWDALLSLTRLPGDANLDGVVNALDCTILEAHLGQSGTMWWMQGDFNHDGVVNAADLALMNANIVGAKCMQ
jgi:hypothetical protein